MLSLSANGELDRAERPVEELKPIQKWDAAYWRNSYTEVHEKVAFPARRERRSEILPQLSSLIQRSDNTRRTPVDLHVQEPERKDRTKKGSVSRA
jgi:hypothetical protein